MSNFRNLAANMTPKGRLMVGGSAAAILLLAFFMMRIAGQPSYTTVMAGIDPKQTGKITAALDAKGIKYEIQNNGTALAVDKSQLAQARIALAEKGLPNSAQPGFELFDSQKLGASDFQQQVTYQRALEGQLAGTIGQIDGVGRRHRAARAAAGPAVRRQAVGRQGLGAAVRQLQLAAAGRDPRHRPARVRQRQGPRRRTTSRSPTRPASSCGRTPPAARPTARWPRPRSRPPRRATRRAWSRT